MEPMEYIAIATAALKLYQSLRPQIEDILAKGQVTVEQLASLRQAETDIDKDYDLPEYQEQVPTTGTPPTAPS